MVAPRHLGRGFYNGVTGASLYPWTEFVETDDERYAAQMPNPGRPRAILADRAALPDHLATDVVERADRLFSGMKDGPLACGWS